MSTANHEEPDFEINRLQRWLSTAVDPTITGLAATRIGGGNSSGAWQLDFQTDAGPGSLVLKTTSDSGLVFDRRASREGRIFVAAKRLGAPVPSVVAIDDSDAVVGRPCFVMERIEGRAAPESTPASFHGKGWFRDEPAAVQQGVWWSFLDTLAALHAVEPTTVPAHYGVNGIAGVLDYWRASLLDAAPAGLVPRQLAAIDWVGDNIPGEADQQPALCMGDARLGNALPNGSRVTTLVDFEVAYIGNPVADIGYCLMQEAFTRLLTDRPATGIPTPQQTWERWEQLTGRSARQRDYWTAFGTTILCVTGTRAMLNWGVPAEGIDTANIAVSEWETLIDRATS